MREWERQAAALPETVTVKRTRKAPGNSLPCTSSPYYSVSLMSSAAFTPSLLSAS